ncbi:hypothetical protein K1719_027855 [Acacia pycnantha]|nr:hypothetical protein K1719_027855 [Acacia pycnantha]
MLRSGGKEVKEESLVVVNGNGLSEPKFAEVVNKTHQNIGVVEWVNLNKLIVIKADQKPRNCVGMECGIIKGDNNLRICAISSLSSLRIYQNNGYLMVSSNGGLNQIQAGISDMVVIARYLNLTLIVPELDNTFFSQDRSRFEDLFDIDYFINSLRDDVKILKELPAEVKKKLEKRYFYSLHQQVGPTCLAIIILFFLELTTPTEEVGKKIATILRKKGPFLALHLRYEMDMLAFSGFYEDCNKTEREILTEMRYAYPWWKEKEIDTQRKMQNGLCPLTPEETALILRALDIDPQMQIYIAAGDTYGGERRMAPLRKAFPNLVKKETLLEGSDLDPFQNHSNRMVALNCIVSIESDIFVPTFPGNMAKVIEGHTSCQGSSC